MIDLNKIFNDQKYYLRRRETNKNEKNGEIKDIYGVPEPVLLRSVQPYISNKHNDPNGVRKNYSLLAIEWIGMNQGIKEQDLICIDVASDEEPDYRVAEIEDYSRLGLHKEIYLERRLKADANRGQGAIKRTGR